MSDSVGTNLPGFRSIQLDFAAHIRNPEQNPRPADVSAERMQIYLDLFYNNIEGFLAGAFPVAKSVLGDELWHLLARRFVHEHPSDSPYFLDISQEFLSFLDQSQPEQAPGFLLELCHYEWVELAAKVDERELPVSGFDAKADLLSSHIVLNPVLWVLSYRYPVQRIRQGYQPETAPQTPTFLAVYRTADDQVRFVALTQVSYRLLLGLTEQSTSEPGPTGAEALESLWSDLYKAAAKSRPVRELDPSAKARFLSQGSASLGQWRELGIVLGGSDGKSGLT